MDQLRDHATRLATGIKTVLTGGERMPSLALYPKQAQIKSEARRFNVLDVGRRAGKTHLGMHLALETACAGDPVGWFSPGYKYLLEVWQTLTRLLRPVSDKINATERRIELNNGGVVECWTLDNNDDPGRSRKYKRAIVDEAAIAPNLKSAWEEAIRATLADLEGDAWFLSTPKGLNYFFDLFKRGQDSAAHPDWRSWQMPSSVNPFLPATEIEAARLELPEMTFRQEFLAEFLSGEGAVFRNVDACMNALATRPEDHRGHYLCAGVDWGRSHDFTAISVLCCHCEQEVKLDRFNQIGWDFQRQRLLSTIEAWRVSHTVVETNSIGGPNLEALRQIMNLKQVLQGFEMTSKSKAPLIQSLALAFERERCQWLPDAVAKHELIAYEATITESGFTKYGAPEGGWDDTVIARALAWKAAKHKIPYPLPDEQREERTLPENLRAANAPPYGTGWERDGWEMARSLAIGKAKKAEERRNRPQDDPWGSASPLDNMADNPWKGWDK